MNLVLDTLAVRHTETAHQPAYRKIILRLLAGAFDVWGF
jgi:hypothetical protein